MIWAAQRNREQGALVAAMYDRAATVPCERRAVMAGGLPEAGTAEVLARAGVEVSRYLRISLDGIKEEMAARGMIPRVSGLSLMEASELVHAESAWIAKRLGLRAIADGRNILWDITMASATVVTSWLDVLDRNGYAVQGFFAEIAVEESVRRAEARYRRQHEDYYRHGIGYGGRYVPPEAIRALAAGSPPAQGPPPGAAGAEVATLIDKYAAGELSRKDLARRFRARPWPDVPPACPPGLERAAPAIDDPEPYVPGSFDDVAAAYDRGQLTELDYEILIDAAAKARRAGDNGERQNLGRS